MKKSFDKRFQFLAILDKKKIMTKQKICYIPAKASSIFDEKSVGWPSEHNTHKCTGKRGKTINIRLLRK